MRPAWLSTALVLTGVWLPACTSTPSLGLDAGLDAFRAAVDAPAADTGRDALAVDGGRDGSFVLVDAGALDSGPDSGGIDAAEVADAGRVSPDAEPLDGGRDAPSLDAATLDAGAAAPDAPDASELDAASDDSGPPDAPRPPPDAAFDAAGCGTVVTGHPLAPALHVPACDPVTYASNPPTSGSHYGSWPAFGVYATPIPWGFLVHGLEHGAVVVAYDCPSGCDAEVALLVDYLDARAADPLCSRDVHHRVIVVPDPTLGTRFAAAAWGWSLRSDCFDLEALGAFLDAHYAMAPENFCADGLTGLSCP